MRLSTRSTYGIRALVELALAEGYGPVSAASIATRQNLSVAYLEQLLHKLKKGGLVRSIRGPRGGYVLARSAELITMTDAVRSLEENHHFSGLSATELPIDEPADSRALDAARRATLVSNAVWRCVHERLADALTGVTLKDICEDVLNPATEPLEHRYVFQP